MVLVSKNPIKSIDPRRINIRDLGDGLISGGLIVASVFLLLSVRSGTDNTYVHRVGAPMSYLATTLGLIIIALLVRQLLNWLPARRRQTAGAERDGIPLNGNNV